MRTLRSGTSRRPLGSILAERGAVRDRDVDQALADQKGSGRRLGEILLERDLVSRPLLTRILAEQNGVRLEHETGFGTGLRAEIERRHRQRTSLRMSPVAARPVGMTGGGRRYV